MSTTFDRTLVSAADSFFLLPGAETVLYKPKTGSPRSIRAVVSRNQAEPIAGVDGGSAPRFEVLVKNDGTNGIASDELDTGGDRIDMAKRVADIPKTLRLVELLSQNAGLCRIGAM